MVFKRFGTDPVKHITNKTETMKTIKNEMKRASWKSITLFASMVFLTSTVMAIEPPVSGADKSADKVEMSMESATLLADTGKVLLNELDLNEASEEDIQIENWMYDLDNEFWWEILAPENEIQVEVWMSTPWNWFEDDQSDLLSCK